MTGQSLYTFLYDWVVSVLGPSVPVIQAFQNISPPTTGQYIALEDDNDWQPFGRAAVVQDALEEGVNHSYVVRPVFWEVRGTGDSLRKLREDLDKETTKALFFAAEIGILRTTDQILSMPYLTSETQYIREKRWQPSFTVNNYTTDAAPSVATVEVHNQIGETP